jgi:hypothetical protein
MGTIIKMILDYSFRTLEPPTAIDEEIDTVAVNKGEDSEAAEDVATDDNNDSESEEG